ncbi:hypothetical protein WICPIJ_004068 [Wickerhamomyces pijperi]|uniref:Uncharacterized protein n=1 Tax=Wickerhamomyces pijperi TaxID=599730 RepID=A0A9P8Q8E8_WICPI|nr:hypothetical protein WICPIJ_004068 [Wickerhamomyces pijperi]
MIILNFKDLYYHIHLANTVHVSTTITSTPSFELDDLTFALFELLSEPASSTSFADLFNVPWDPSPDPLREMASDEDCDEGTSSCSFASAVCASFSSESFCCCSSVVRLPTVGWTVAGTKEVVTDSSLLVVVQPVRGVVHLVDVVAAPVAVLAVAVLAAVSDAVIDSVAAVVVPAFEVSLAPFPQTSPVFAFDQELAMPIDVVFVRLVLFLEKFHVLCLSVPTLDPPYPPVQWHQVHESALREQGFFVSSVGIHSVVAVLSLVVVVEHQQLPLQIRQCSLGMEVHLSVSQPVDQV